MVATTALLLQATAFLVSTIEIALECIQRYCSTTTILHKQTSSTQAIKQQLVVVYSLLVLLPVLHMFPYVRPFAAVVIVVVGSRYSLYALFRFYEYAGSSTCNGTSCV